MKLAENKALSNLFNKAFIYYACLDYKTPIGIIVNTDHTINGKDIKYYIGQPLNIQDTVRFKGSSKLNNKSMWNWIGTSRQLDGKDKHYTRWYGRFTDLPGVGKPKVEKWVDLGLTGFIDLVAIMDGDMNNYKNLMILPGVGSAESCKKMIISEQFTKWFMFEYEEPAHYMKEV